MKAVIETARQKSKAGKRPLAVVTDDERESFDKLQTHLDDIAFGEEHANELLLLARDPGAKLSRALASYDTKAIFDATEDAIKSADLERLATEARRNFQSARERLWREQGDVVLKILRRAQDEAQKRLDKLTADELRESAATGEAAYVQSAGAAFLTKRVRSLELDLSNPDKRLRNRRCAKALLADHGCDAE